MEGTAPTFSSGMLSGGMGIEKDEIRTVKTSLHAFNGTEVKPLGVIALPVYAADRITEVKFLVVDTLRP